MSASTPYRPSSGVHSVRILPPQAGGAGAAASCAKAGSSDSRKAPARRRPDHFATKNARGHEEDDMTGSPFSKQMAFTFATSCVASDPLEFIEDA